MLILVWVERRGSKTNNYTSKLWDINRAYAFKCLFNPRLSLPAAYQPAVQVPIWCQGASARAFEWWSLQKGKSKGTAQLPKNWEGLLYFQREWKLRWFTRGDSMGSSELVCMDGCKQVQAPLLWLNLVQKLWSCATAVLKLTCLSEKLIELCGFQTKSGSWPTSLEHRQSELMSPCTHPWRWDIEVVFHITARILFLPIPGLSEHHTYEPGLWVCLDQRKNNWCRGCSRERDLRAVEKQRTLEFLNHFENLG